ncbi:hypothetical protein PGT21_002106 [Puccinia graminis f. sp. tritici]|uniref:Uncharacterized protein n=1 Tax=Puccinia graminis f. sp. tritici TaxID=56615 RepID=A0A5B0NM09_PUCGR|nr:hypothetical protein PGT21_002106 [Puccinia graminis f. sp. tritici]
MCICICATRLRRRPRSCQSIVRSWAIDSLQASLLDHLEPSNPVFSFAQTAAWAAAASLSLAPFAPSQGKSAVEIEPH